MAARDPSFRKINYLLRPTKQVERRLVAEALSRLTLAGYAIPTYRYLGLGSVYYADFVLFHKALYIDDMWCVESEDVPLAMEFNKPFSFVRIIMGSVSTVLPTLDRNRPHIVWLDYDSALTDSQLDDVGQCVSVLAPGSIFLVSVNARPPLLDVENEADACRDARRMRDLEVLQARFGKYRRVPLIASDLSRKGVARLYHDVISKRVTSEIVNRPGERLKFYQLFSWRYADRAPMFTYGGLLDRPRRERRMAKARLALLDFIQPDVKAEPFEISLPMLTASERRWLDQHQDDDPRTEHQFELSSGELANFRKFARHYPNYNEVLF